MTKNHKPNILGISGVGRSGKDTFYSFIPSSANARRLAFADALKQECRDFLASNIGISPFTSDPKEKELIRPFLVTYGTHLRRKLNPSCWIDKVKQDSELLIKDGLLPVVTDVRYKNEADWIHEQGGKLIHISRTAPHHRFPVNEPQTLPPLNKEELENDPILIAAADELIKWKTTQNKEGFPCSDYCKPIVEQCLRKLQIIN